MLTAREIKSDYRDTNWYAAFRAKAKEIGIDAVAKKMGFSRTTAVAVVNKTGIYADPRNKAVNFARRFALEFGDEGLQAWIDYEVPRPRIKLAERITPKAPWFLGLKRLYDKIGPHEMALLISSHPEADEEAVASFELMLDDLLSTKLFALGPNKERGMSQNIHDIALDRDGITTLLRCDLKVWIGRKDNAGKRAVQILTAEFIQRFKRMANVHPSMDSLRVFFRCLGAFEQPGPGGKSTFRFPKYESLEEFHDAENGLLAALRKEGATLSDARKAIADEELPSDGSF